MQEICVIGGANIDICGASIDPLRMYDSNPGMIGLSFGGVGRNIAQMCVLLGQKVRFVTCFSDDSYGQMMKQDCEAMGMDCTDSVVAEGLPSSMYLAILDSDRDMKIAMSDMRILRRLDTEHLKHALDHLDNGDIIIIDANLDMESISYILEHAPCMTAADPVSTKKAPRLAGSLKDITIFKPNQYEAKELTGIAIKDEESAAASLQWFLDAGVREIIISMADKGILLGTPEEKVWLSHKQVIVENATGGGDSFLGAYTAERLRGKSPKEAAYAGISAAVTVISRPSSSRKRLDMADIRTSIREMDIKEKQL